MEKIKINLFLSIANAARDPDQETNKEGWARPAYHAT